MFVMPNHADKNESISTSVRPSQGLQSPDGSSGRCEMYHTHLDYSQARRQEGMHGNWPEGGSERARPRERWLLCLALGPERSSIKEDQAEQEIGRSWISGLPDARMTRLHSNLEVIVIPHRAARGLSYVSRLELSSDPGEERRLIGVFGCMEMLMMFGERPIRRQQHTTW